MRNREHLQDKYLYRTTAAVDWIYGNSEEEAIYPTCLVDLSGAPLLVSAAGTFSRGRVACVGHRTDGPSTSLFDAGSSSMEAHELSGSVCDGFLAFAVGRRLWSEITSTVWPAIRHLMTLAARPSRAFCRT
jgi:hypothetical protein